MYYLNSRFYNAEIGRFISADIIDVVLASQTTLTDKNLYAYCDNNSVMRIDESGEFWNLAVGAIAGGTISAAAQIIGNVITGDKWTTGVMLAAVTGAASGALSASALGKWGQGFANAGISLIGGDGMRNSNSNYCKAAKSAKQTAEKVFSKTYNNAKTASKILNKAIKMVKKVGYKESMLTGAKFVVGCGNAQVITRWEIK